MKGLFMNKTECVHEIEESTVDFLKCKAAEMRIKIIDSIYHAHSGHPGGSLSIVEILSYLYFYRMHVDKDDPSLADRDRLVLSKGHGAPALYAALAMKGFFPEEELDGLRKTGRMLQGHPDRKHTPGVDMSTGSLGQGISAACGMALAAKHYGMGYDVYAILGDGELQEGQVWEAAMYAPNKKLNNLCAFIDYNRLQISGNVSEVMDLGDLEAKFKAFGWNTTVIDGHDFHEIDEAWRKFKASDRPMAVICNTVKGKGVSFMENNFAWHGNAPTEKEYNVAIAELKAAFNKLTEKDGENG